MKKILTVLGGLLLLPLLANADLPGKHPAYLHALTDLRAARWMLEHRPGDAAVSANEDAAINEIDTAIREISTPRSMTAKMSTIIPMWMWPPIGPDACTKHSNS